MNLNHSKTEPKVVSKLIFSEREVKDALIEYARQKAYVFNPKSPVSFVFWDARSSGRTGAHFSLSTECLGTCGGISGKGETV